MHLNAMDTYEHIVFFYCIASTTANNKTNLQLALIKFFFFLSFGFCSLHVLQYSSSRSMPFCAPSVRRGSDDSAAPLSLAL